MSYYPHYKVGCDAHKHYSLFSVLDDHAHLIQPTRVNHEPGAIRAFLSIVIDRELGSTDRFPTPGTSPATPASSPGIRWARNHRFAQAGPGPCPTWVPRDR